MSIFVFSDTRHSVILIKDMIEEFTKKDHVPGVSYSVFVFCLMAATYFHEYEIAFKLMEVKASYLRTSGSFVSVMGDFFLGLLSLSLAKRSTEKLEFLSIANRCIEELTKRSMSGHENISNKLALLRAEQSAVNGDESFAVQFFNQSIASAKKSKFMHEEALACERAAIYLFERKKEHHAHCYLLQAYKSYFYWGATAKLIQLRHLYPFFLTKFDSCHESFSPTTDIPSDICLSGSSESVSVVSEFNTGSISNSK